MLENEIKVRSKVMTKRKEILLGGFIFVIGMTALIISVLAIKMIVEC